MIEHEKKILLTDTEYKKLLQLYGSGKLTIKQSNFYYDTDEFYFNKNGITCRIRDKNGKCVATIKKHRMDNIEKSIEYSQIVENEYDNSLFSDMNVVLQGCLVTERSVIIKNDDLEVVLDKNTYLNFTDYELEIEYLLESELRAEKLLHVLAESLYLKEDKTKVTEFCQRVEESRSKSKRFFERKCL